MADFRPTRSSCDGASATSAHSSNRVGANGSGPNISSCSHVTATSLTTHQRRRPREPGRRISTTSARSERADPSGSRSRMLPSASTPTTLPTTHRPEPLRRNLIGSPMRRPNRARAAGERCISSETIWFAGSEWDGGAGWDGQELRVVGADGQRPITVRCSLRMPPSQRSGLSALSRM